MRNELTKLYLSKRAFATLIDYIIVWTFFFFYVMEIGSRNDHGGYTVEGWLALGPVAFWFLFIVVSECYLGGTLGHIIFKLSVVPINNEKMTLWRTFKRRCVDMIEISWCFGLIAYIIASNTSRNRRLGDLIAKTCVIGNGDSLLEFSFDFEKNQAQFIHSTKQTRL